jgi:hypothetical protein
MTFLRSLTLAGALFAMTLPAAAGKCDAEAFVLSAGNAFMTAARAGSPQAFTSAAGRYADLRSIALFALGQHRKSLPKGREGEYVSLAKGYMGRFLSRHASKFSGSGLKVVSLFRQHRQCQHVGRQEADLPRLRRQGRLPGAGRERRLDLAGGQMRSTFVGVLNRNHGDINALFAYLRK